MTGLTVWNVILAVVVGYLIGAFPTGVIVSRALTAPDPRTHGSGHTGGLNVLRLAGPIAGVITGLVDLSKGVLAVWLVWQVTPNPWIPALTGVAAVIGHCWSVYVGYKGGMGIATAAGLAAWFFPLLIPIAAGAFLFFQLLLRHQARAVMLTAAAMPLVLMQLGVDTPKLTLGIGLSLVLMIRWAQDFNRVYD